VKGFGYQSSFEIPDGIETIGPCALSSLRTVSQVTIPSSVRRLEASPFCYTGIYVLSLPDTISADA
jgi:hypothetical protein